MYCRLFHILSLRHVIIAALYHDIRQFLPIDISRRIEELEIQTDCVSGGHMEHALIGEQRLRPLGFQRQFVHL